MNEVAVTKKVHKSKLRRRETAEGTKHFELWCCFLSHCTVDFLDVATNSRVDKCTVLVFFNL